VDLLDDSGTKSNSSNSPRNKDELSGSGSLACRVVIQERGSTGVEVEDWVGSTVGPDKEGSRSAGHDTYLTGFLLFGRGCDMAIRLTTTPNIT
jgi:hypothetical protein